jgi:asparagine synthase (glutamine-hydrolysing)
MPGIAGFISKLDCVSDLRLCAKMVKCMLHEDFYRSGMYENASLGVSIGWVNIGNSFSDCLPIWNETHDLCLVFVGEDFPDPHALVALKSKGHCFSAETASYLIHLYEEFGVAFLHGLNGQFSGVLIDLRKRMVVLFNDRLGLNRIYYHENKTGFYFSSEAKSLLAVLPETREMDAERTAELVSLGCVLDDRTIFKDILLLPAASAWEFNRQQVRRGTYFDRSVLEASSPLSPDSYYETLKGTWSEVVPRYFRGPQKVSVSLTGGVDSRMVLAWARRPAGEVPCYTIGGPYKESNDVKLSRKIAAMCRQPFSVVQLDDRFIQEFSNLAERAVYLSDGTADVKAACDLFAQREARKIAPVRVSGVYGGEILRRLIVFKPANLCERVFIPALRSGFRAAEKNYRQHLLSHPVSFSTFKQVNWQLFGAIAPDRSQIVFRSPYLDNALVRLAYATPPEFFNDNYISLRLAADGAPALARLPTDRGLSFPKGVVARARHAVEQFTFKAEYALDYGMPQWFAPINNFLKPIEIDRVVLGRHKFYHFRKWYQVQLADYLRETLLGPSGLRCPFLDRQEVSTVVAAHLKGARNFTAEIHKILMCEMISKSLIATS